MQRIAEQASAVPSVVHLAALPGWGGDVFWAIRAGLSLPSRVGAVSGG